MIIESGIHVDNTCVRFYTSFATLTINRTFVASGRIQAFRKAVKFVTWMFRDDPEALDDALSSLEYVIEEEGVNNRIMDQHIEAINNIRRKYGIQQAGV